MFMTAKPPESITKKLHLCVDSEYTTTIQDRIVNVTVYKYNHKSSISGHKENTTRRWSISDEEMLGKMRQEGGENEQFH